MCYVRIREEFEIAYGLRLFKRELIKKCFFQLPDEQQLGEDLLCLCLCIMESKRILLQRCAYYHYVMKAQSLSHMPSENFNRKKCGIMLSHNRLC